MKFRTSLRELKKALKLLSPVVNYNHASLFYRYILVRKDNNKIEFKAFDNSVVASAFIPYSDLEEDAYFSGYVLAKNFISLVNGFSGDEIFISITDKSCNIKCNNSSYKLGLLDREVGDSELKDIDIIYYDKEFKGSEINIKAFATRALSIQHCLPRENSQYSLQHIYIKDKRMIACDGVKGAVIDFDSPLDDVLIYKKVIDCIINISDSNSILIERDAEALYGKTENFIFYATLPREEYPYPDIKGIIEKFEQGQNFCFKVDAGDFIEKLNRVLLFADSDTNAVQVGFGEKYISLIVENNNRAEESVPFFESEKTGKIQLLVDGRSLKELLGKTLGDALWYSDGTEEVQFIYDGTILQFFLGLEK